MPTPVMLAQRAVWHGFRGRPAIITPFKLWGVFYPRIVMAEDCYPYRMNLRGDSRRESKSSNPSRRCLADYIMDVLWVAPRSSLAGSCNEEGQFMNTNTYVQTQLLVNSSITYQLRTNIAIYTSKTATYHIQTAFSADQDQTDHHSVLQAQQPILRG